jgi:hypothetical protein
MDNGTSWMVSKTARLMMGLVTAVTAGGAVMVATNSGSVAHAGGKSAPAKQGAPAQVSREQILNQVLRLHASEIITLDVDSTPARAVRTPIAIEGNQYTIDLEPYSIRAPGYQLRAQLADGSIVEVDPGPV